MQTLYGVPEPPPGFYPCYDRSCPDRKSPATGRLSGQHYHPLKKGVPCPAVPAARCENPDCPTHATANLLARAAELVARLEETDA